MKMKKFIAFASVAVALTACSNNEEVFVNSNFPEDGVIRVATNVDAPATRSGVENSNLTSFYMDVKNDNSVAYSYFVQMKKESDAWSSYEGETLKQMLWQNKTTPIKVTAAYLKDHAFTKAELQGTVDLSVTADQSATGAVEANDLVAMAQTTIKPATADENLVNGKIKVTLGHALAKLNLKVTLGTEFNEETNGTTTDPITAITINGTKLKYTYTGADASITLPETNNDAADVTPFAGNYTAGEGTTTNAEANYECILVPQEILANGFSVTMVIKDKTYKWTSKAAVNMEQGKAYALNLTAGKETLVAKGLSVAAWEEEIEGADLGTDFAPTNFKSEYAQADFKTWSTENCGTAPSYDELIKYINAGTVYWDGGTVGTAETGLQTYITQKNNTSIGSKETQENHSGIWLLKKSKWPADITGNKENVSTTTITANNQSIRTNGDYFFLPAAGYYRSSFYGAGVYGYYWSSTPYGSDSAYRLYFRGGLAGVDGSRRDFGFLLMVAE